MLLASYVLYVCVLLHATLSGWSVGWSYFTKTTCACLFIREPVGASVRLVHPRTWFKPPVANCFATDRSKAVTPRVLFFVNCLWCPFEINILIYTCSLSLSSFSLRGEAVFSECGDSWYAYFTFLQSGINRELTFSTQVSTEYSLLWVYLSKYSRTSMARTPWDRQISSSHR